MAQDLFPKPTPKTVTAHDLNGNLFNVTTDKLCLRVGVYGILVNDNNEVLLQRHPSTTLFGLPGGSVEMGESVQETLLREFVEETGLIIKIGKLLAVENDYHTFQEKFCQSVFIFYSVSLVSGQLTGSNGEDVAETRFMSESEITDKLILPVHFPLIKKHLCP